MDKKLEERLAVAEYSQVECYELGQKDILKYIKNTLDEYNKKYQSGNCSISEEDRLGYVIPEFEQILKHFSVKV